MVRPTWSGQIQISLVSFGVKLFPATEAGSEIHFHQLSRRTGERIHHQKVGGDDDPVEKSDIVKGYEYRKGEYVMVEPEEIENLRIASRHALEVKQFVNVQELGPELFERPYFIAPEDQSQADAFAVVRQALKTTRKAGLGKIAFSGREHLIAVMAHPDDRLAGMMGYTLRYAEELRDPAEYFGEIRKAGVDEDQLALAKELIQRKSAKFDAGKFKDEYEAALRELVEAKVQHVPLPRDEGERKSAKVVNLMDALRRSVRGDDDTPVKRSPVSGTAERSTKKGLSLVPTGKTEAKKSQAQRTQTKKAAAKKSISRRPA